MAINEKNMKHINQVKKFCLLFTKAVLRYTDILVGIAEILEKLVSKRNTNYPIFVVRGFNSPLPEIHRFSSDIRQVGITSIINGLNIIDIHRLLHLMTAE